MLSIGTKINDLERRIQRLSEVFKYPLLSQERVKLRTSNLAGTFVSGSILTKPIFKNFEERGMWAYPGTAQSFKVPTIISETGKAMDFKFCTHIHRIDRIFAGVCQVNHF